MLADSAFYQVKRLVIRQPDMFSIIKNNQTMEKDDMDKDMNNLEDKPQVLILENDPALSPLGSA